MSESAQTWALAHADRMSALASRSWVNATADGLVAFLLVAPTSTAVGVEDVAALAASVGLGGPGERMPSVGERIVLHGRSATVQLPEIGRALRVSVTGEWSQLVRQGGTVVILLSADPLPTDAPSKGDIDHHLRVGAESGRLWMGKAVRHGWQGSWAPCGRCARCASGTDQAADPSVPDCYVEFLDAATRRSA